MTATPDDLRRAALSDFAADQFGALDNKVQAFVNVAAYAVHLAEGLPDAADVVIEDLKLVLVGLDYTDAGRNQGPYFIEPVDSLYGNEGFQSAFQQPDGLNQISHAMAAIGISYQASRDTGELVRVFVTDLLGPGIGDLLGDIAGRLREGIFGRAFGEVAEFAIERFALWQEDEPWDDNLYLAGFEVADALDDGDIALLPQLIADLIGDETVSTDNIPAFPDDAVVGLSGEVIGFPAAPTGDPDPADTDPSADAAFVFLDQAEGAGPATGWRGERMADDWTGAWAATREAAFGFDLTAARGAPQNANEDAFLFAHDLPRDDEGRGLAAWDGWL